MPASGLRPLRCLSRQLRPRRRVPSRVPTSAIMPTFGRSAIGGNSRRWPRRVPMRRRSSQHIVSGPGVRAR